MTAAPKSDEIWTKRNALGWIWELLFVVFACVFALYFCFPVAFSQAGSHLWSHTDNPYALGDLGGAIYMVVRNSLGEVGCVATTHGVPWTFDICREVPNPIVTNLLGGAVSSWGMPYGYNVGVLVLLVSNGAAVFLTARLFGARVIWALVGAVVATAAPSIIYEVEGGYVQHVWWGPTVAGFALSIAAVRTWRHFPLVLAGGLVLGLSVQIYAMIPFMLLPWALLAGMSELFLAENRRGVLTRSVLGAVFVSCFVLPQIAGGLESAGPRLFDSEVNANTLMLGLESFTVEGWFGMGFGSGDLVRSPGLLVWPCLVLSVVIWRKAPLFLAPLLGGLIMLGISFGPSMDGGSGASGFNGSLPYSLLMEHITLARGSMRPTRYGAAAVMLLSVALPIILTLCAARLKRLRPKHEGILAVFFVWITMIQIRPTVVSPSLHWPPFPSLPSVEGNGVDTDQVWLDLPFVGQAENRFAQWAFNPAPRLNPPHDLGRWRDSVATSEYYLLRALLGISRGEMPTEGVLSAMTGTVSEISELGLSVVIIHRGAASPTKEISWVEILELAGGERIIADEDVLVYQF